MKRTVWLILLFLSLAKLFAQSNSPYHYKIPTQLKDGLHTGSLSDVDIDSNRIIDLTNKIQSNFYINIHSLLIFRYNKLVYENYFPGHEDLTSGDSGIVNHYRDSVHECRSISKSVVSACIGIAISQGKIKSVNEKVFQYFPEYSRFDTGIKQTMTIKDLLTMTSGVQWREGDSPSTNQEVAMMHSKNPLEYFLSQPMAEKPGTVWNYNGGCTQTLAAIIRKITGEDIDSFANKNIFHPLGITDFRWDKTKEGFLWCASGLKLRSRDLSKFGSLYLNDGKWKNKNVIPSSWINESLNNYFTAVVDPRTYYGYQFWGADLKINNEMVKAFAAMGNGGQIILLLPTKALEIIVTAGNYYDPQLGNQSYKMIANEIYPAIGIKKGKNP